MLGSVMARCVRVFLIYFALAAAALATTRFDGGVAFFWVATSYLIAELSVAPRRRWPLLLGVGAVSGTIATGLFGLGWPAALPMAVANSLEAFVAAYYIRRHAPEGALTTLSWLARYTLFAAIIPPIFSACIAAGVAFWLGKDVLSAGGHFVIGHALSNLTFAPVFTLLLQGEIAKSIRKMADRAVEAVALLGLSAATTLLCFSQHALPLLFLPILPIVLVTFRLGRGGTVLAILFLALFGGMMTMLGAGPAQLVGGTHGMRVQFFQFYLAMTVLTAWPVTADLANRSRLHRQLRTSEARYRLLAENSSDILMQLTPAGLIRYVSPSVRHLGGYEPDALLGTPAVELVAPPYRALLGALHQATLREPHTTHCFEYEAVVAGGDRRWFETHSRAMLDDRGRVDGTLSIIRDVSARKATEETLSKAASTDPLTGLANRRAFEAAVEACLADRRRPHADHVIAVFDIDHFKRVNDTYGHDAGDRVLQNFACLALAAVREGEVVARLGGEEFAILFADTSVASAQAICERLRTELAGSLTIVGEVAIRVTVSGGVAAVGRRGFSETLKAADRALYQAKHAGRDQLAIAA
ncbi:MULTISPECIES: sensor domain-containing diguanylate cyclase [Sphingomonas]|uniref:sensor domain-containing diguanylate cyclase n=1 Tax=Sphingomonas TaxID=13687 RepID=UPI000DEED9A3|nr:MULTISPECIES: diguanylate cyclase [Sphingomonas]